MAGAQSTREKWRARGYDVFIWEFVRPSDGTRWYRVGVGRFASRRDGETAKQLLRAAYSDEIDWSPVTRIPEGAR
jgi:septal ring-binding cell division protein DamX